jgi:predicted O-methyltransferase YrrM
MNKSKEVENWYVDAYKDKSSFRFDSYRMALRLLYERSDEPRVLETGTVRQLNDWGAGYSTYIFGECMSQFGGSLISIDNNSNHLDISKQLTKEFESKITYVLSDSFDYLERFKEELDLVYLDSLDCPIDGDATVAQEHNLREFILVEPRLKDTSLILIDDVNFDNGGKARLTHKYLRDNDYRLLFQNQQSLWERI